MKITARPPLQSEVVITVLLWPSHLGRVWGSSLLSLSPGPSPLKGPRSCDQTIPTQGLDERFASSHVIAKKRPNELHCVLWEKRKTFRFAINCWALHGVTHEIVQTILAYIPF